VAEAREEMLVEIDLYNIGLSSPVLGSLEWREV
jgi:hypothetical protein